MRIIVGHFWLVSVTPSAIGVCPYIDKIFNFIVSHMPGYNLEPYPNVVTEYEVIVFWSQIQPESR